MATVGIIADNGCIDSLANGTAGQVLTINASGQPVWSAASTDDQIASEVTATATAPFTGTTVQALLDSISPHARRTYANDQSATLLNNTNPTAPVSPPAAPVSNEVLIEYYGDGIATWEYSGTTWALRGVRHDCCISAPVTIPAAAFADANAPTIAEVQTWVAANQPNAERGQQIIYPLNGTTDDPNFVWTVDGDGTVTNIENATFFDANEIEGAGTAASPFGTRLIAASMNISNQVYVAGTWTNIAFGTVGYDTDAMATTGAASSFTIPVSGVYHIDCYTHFFADFQGAPGANGYQAALGLWIDGVFVKRMDDYYSDIGRPAGSAQVPISLSGSVDHTIFAGSVVTLQVLLFAPQAGNATADGSSQGNWVNIHRVH